MPNDNLIKSKKWSKQALSDVANEVADCLCLIECTRAGVSFLWDVRSLSSPMLPRLSPDAFTGKVSWKRSDRREAVVKIGSLGGAPVEILIMRELLDGIPVGFYCGASPVVDHSMIENFLEKSFPGIESINASNFGQFYARREELAARALRQEMAAAIPTAPGRPRSSL